MPFSLACCGVVCLGTGTHFKAPAPFQSVDDINFIKASTVEDQGKETTTDAPKADGGAPPTALDMQR